MQAGTRIASTSCRLCAGSCGLKLEIDARGTIVSVRGDKANPVTEGYACLKGLSAHEALNHPQRILHPLKRQADGRFAAIELETALDEIATSLRSIMAALDWLDLLLFDDDRGPVCQVGHRGTPRDVGGRA